MKSRVAEEIFWYVTKKIKQFQNGKGALSPRLQGVFIFVQIEQKKKKKM